MTLLRVSIILLITVLLTGCPESPSSEAISCSVTVQKTNVENSTVLDIKMTNNTDKEIYYLDRYNPFSSTDEKFFSVTKDGKNLKYYGPVARYENLDENSFSSIAAGNTKSVNYDLGDFYDFWGGGKIEVVPDISLKIFTEAKYSSEFEGKLLAETPLNCNIVSLNLTEKIGHTGRFTPPCQNGLCPGRLCTPDGPPRGVYTPACKPRIEDNCARQFSKEKVLSLHRETWFPPIDSQSSATYRWFGNLNSGQFQRLRTKAGDIGWKFSRSSNDYSCLGPGEALYSLCFNFEKNSRKIAFVIPSRRWPKIYLCPLFYKLPKKGGFETQRGVIIHEVSHLRPTDTRDHAYGLKRASNLARNNPELAISNADNFQYYYEDVTINKQDKRTKEN